MNRFIPTKPLQQFQTLLRRGATPRQLSLAIALSVPLGIIPLFVLVTPLATALAIRLRLNVPLVLGMLYLALPLQLMLFIPFLRMGEMLFQLPPLPFTPAEIMMMIETTGWGFFQQIWVTNLAALAVWSLLAFPLGCTLFYLGRWAFLRWQGVPCPIRN